MRLFCVPFAGGGASVYRGWAESLPDVEVCPVELPGRGTRVTEPPLSRLDAVVDGLVPALLPWTDKPFAIFGHSMGAWVAFETARRLRDVAKVSPARLIVSGQAAPHAARRGRPIHDLPDAAFLEEIRRLGGTPPAVLQNRELMALLMPVLRADFATCQSYRPLPGMPLTCPVSAYGGLNDAMILPDSVAAWNRMTRGDFQLRMFPGDHFFIQSDREAVLEAVGEDLESVSRHRAMSLCS